jgi:hypothetical protein
MPWERFWMRWCVVAAWGGILMSAASGQERELSVTVYNNDLAAVRDVRTVSITAGVDTFRFVDVPEEIDPTSVLLEPADGKPLVVLEQNYAYDLVSADALLKRYLDREIQVLNEEGDLLEGRLLSYSDGQLLLRPRDGGVRVLSRKKISEIRCPRLPEDLYTRPTLVWVLSSDAGGERRVRLSYLTSGMSWKARYVAVVNEASTQLRLAAWVNIRNESGATYPNASLQLVAGEVHRVSPGRRPRHEKGIPTRELALAAVPQFEEEAFFEYHLYTLDQPTTLADREKKQIALFAPTEVAVSKEYEYAAWKGDKVRVVLVFTNDEEAGLGRPLPAGIVRVYQEDSRGRLQFIGEDRVDHTPRGEEVRLFLGQAFDLVAERKVLDVRKIGRNVREEDVEISLRNRKEEGEVEIVVSERLYGYWEITRSSHPYEKKEATLVEFRPTIPAGEEVKLTYTVRYTY